MRGKRTWLHVIVVCAALVAQACSGAPRPADTVAAATDDDPSATGATTAAPDSGTATEGGAPTSGGRSSSGAPSGPSSPSGGSPSGPASGTAPAGSEGGSGPGRYVANLWGPSEDRIGITDTEIKLCGHAAILLAEAFDTRPEDLNFYWDKVNAEGGIHGRKVSLSWEDDAYSPDTAVDAAKKCKDKDPFLLLGGIGFDQIPAVRNWAETNKMLYVHHIAVADDSKQYSFTSLPTVQEVGRAFGEHIVAKHAGKKIGILYRVSENWGPGHDAGRQYLDANGVNVVSDLGVNNGQTLFTQQILDMKGKGVEVVWIWENALAAGEFIAQSHAQDFHPTFVVFPFQTTLDLVGEDALTSPIEGVAAWPAYKPGGYSGPYAFTQYEYQQEIERFEAALAEYRPDTEPNDILWQVWMGMKGLHLALLDCGPDCTRNVFAGMMLGGYQKTVNPACPVDFARNPHKGGWHFLLHEAFDGGGGDAYYRTVRWCTEHLT